MQLVKQMLPIIQSPLNYTGGKYRLLGQILPHFPGKIDKFIDLFCGGCNVGINIQADSVIFNDNNYRLLYLYSTFKSLGKEAVLNMVNEIIDKYGLSKSSENGYKFYNCDSSAGLGEYNREPFLRLRNDFNRKNEDYHYYAMLYTLIVYAFNNQIRFNANGEFNLPVGKRDFNDKMKSKACAFIDRLQEGRYQFECKNFSDVDLSVLTGDSLVYCDPPYLITCATYNEQGGWNEQRENDLLDLLDTLNEHRIKFALSNVLSSKGKKNEILARWLGRGDYKVKHLNYSYSNSNYHTKDKSNSTDEVLIVNY
jgi:DNA adenine methylase Dam